MVVRAVIGALSWRAEGEAEQIGEGKREWGRYGWGDIHLLAHLNGFSKFENDLPVSWNPILTPLKVSESLIEPPVS